MRFAKTSALIILLSVGLVACGDTSRPSSDDTSRPSSPPTDLKLENLLQAPLADEFTPGREIVVSYVEIPPDTTMKRHWHPGEEFHYYLEGEVEIAIDGEPSIHGTPGTVGHVPFKTMHTAITGDEGAKLVVFRVHTEGKPVRYFEGGGTAEQ